MVFGLVPPCTYTSIDFEKAQGRTGKVNRMSVYAEAAVQRVL